MSQSYVPGIDVRKRLVNIDSRFRPDRKQPSSNFTFPLANPIRNVISISLSSIEIPNTFYTFSAEKRNTVLQLKVTGGNGSVFSITVPDGNYSADDLVCKIDELLKAINSANGTAFAIELDAVSGKATLSNNAAFEVSFPGFLDRRYDAGLGHHLGFRQLSYKGASAYTSESIMDVIGDNYVFLQLEGLEALEHQNQTINTMKCFAKIIVRQEKNAMIFDDGSNFLSKEVTFQQPVMVSRLRVRLTDCYGETINLNDMNMSMTIEVHEVVNAHLYEDYRTHLLGGAGAPLDPLNR